jgi:hypothetical protein
MTVRHAVATDRIGSGIHSTRAPKRADPTPARSRNEYRSSIYRDVRSNIRPAAAAPGRDAMRG